MQHIKKDNKNDNKNDNNNDNDKVIINEIEQKLLEIEAKEQIKILHAVESGSIRLSRQ